MAQSDIFYSANLSRRGFLGLGAAATASVLLAGCSSSGTSTTDQGATASTELTKVTVCEPVRGILWAPVYAAKAKGFFEEQGLDVEITTVQSDMPTAPVLAGEADFGLYGPEMICKFVSEGQDTELLFTCTDVYPYSFFLAKDIASVADLKGKVVNGADSGSSPRAYVRSIINNAGLDADNDVTYANMSNSAVVAALESGEISATYASPELRSKLIAAGYEVAIDIYDKEVHKEVIGSETYEMYIVFGKKSFIDANNELTQKFINGCYQGAQYLDTTDADTIITDLKSMFTEMEDFEGIVKECKENDLWSPDGLFTDSGVSAINKMAKEAGLITEDVPKSELIDESFAKNAAKNA